MSDLLVTFGHALSVLLIGTGIAILIWNLSVLAGELTPRRVGKVVVRSPLQPHGRGNDIDTRT